RHGGARLFLGQAHHFAVDCGVFDGAPAGVAQTTSIGPAHSEHTLRERDRIDVHVLGPVVAGEALQRLRIAQDDVAVRVGDAWGRRVDERPRAFADLGALAVVG